MNKIYKLAGRLLMISTAMFMATGCSDDDNRPYEAADIVGVKVDGVLYTPSATSLEATTIIKLPAGKDLTNNKLQVLVANGEPVGFINNAEYDCRKPMPLQLKGYDGSTVSKVLRIQSAPKLVSFIIKGMNVPASSIYESATSYIVQVPEGTDLKALEVTMEFANGTLTDFTNGVAKDYTDPIPFNIMGVDEETVYPYELVITTQEVGPASIQALIVNGVKTDSIVVNNGKLIPYIPSLIDFTNVTLDLETGYGNKVDESFTGQGVNLMSGDVKVKVIGTNGIPTDFVIGTPQLSFAPAIYKTYSELGMGANDLCSVGFSGDYLIAGYYTSPTKAPVYFDMNGDQKGFIDVTGVNVSGYGLRKFDTDSKGAILSMSLGMSAGEQWIYKWDNVTGQGKEYISFSKASLGVDYSPRSAGISVAGALDADATITLTIAQKQDAFVWTVTGGTLNPTPKKVQFPYGGSSYYWGLVPMSASADGFIGMVTNAQLANAGVVKFDRNMQESFRVSGFYATDGDVITYKGRTYLAYVRHNNNVARMIICDVTDGQASSYSTPLFDRTMEVEGSNGNATMDAKFGVVGGKLHVAFCCSNLALYMYEFDN